MRKVITAVVACLLTASSAGAELRHVEIKTLGMDWETCAHAVRVAMQKVEGVQQVRVSLKEGLTVLDLKPDNRVTLAKLREVIKNNGFVSRDAVVLASGAEVTGAKVPTFEVTGTGERLQLSGPVTKDQQGSWRFTSPAK